MIRKKYENFFFAASRVRFFLTPGQTETNNFFSWLNVKTFNKKLIVKAVKNFIRVMTTSFFNLYIHLFSGAILILRTLDTIPYPFSRCTVVSSSMKL